MIRKSSEALKSVSPEQLVKKSPALSQSSDLDAQLEEILADAASVVRSELGLNVGFISEFSAGRRVIRAVDSSEEESVLKVGDSNPLEDSYCQRLVDGRFPTLINDALEFPDASELPITSELSIRAYAGVPICFPDGEVYGTFCCFSTETGKEFDDKDLNLMSVFSEFVGRQIRRVQNMHGFSAELSQQVQSILDDQLMHPVYQPICDIRERRIIGYEALIRFDVEPYSPPDIWFSAAASIGLQTELEIAAINAALKNLEHIPEGCYVSVNVSPETLTHPSFFDYIRHCPPDRLLIEVTEHDSVSDYELFNGQLKHLRDRGTQLAIDDVGAGYSSLRHILELKPEVIKLDRSLITEIDKRSDLRSMAEALIKFSADMDIKVVAEGIETTEELDLLNEVGITRAQGYFLGRPVPIDQLKRQWGLQAGATQQS